MKRSYLLSVFILLTHIVFSQPISSIMEKATSLYETKSYEEASELLKTFLDDYSGKVDSSLIETYLLYGKIQMHSWSTSSAQKTYAHAWELSKEVNAPKLSIRSGMALVTLLRYQQRQDTLKVIIDELLAIDELTPKDRSDLYINIASYYEDAEVIDSSIYYAQKATEIDSILQDSSSAPFSYMDHANYLIAKFEYEQAVDRMLVGMNYLRGEKDIYKRDAMEIALSNIYLGIGNVYRAEELAEKVRVNAKENNYHVNHANALNMLGNCADFLGRHEIALAYYEKSDSVNQSKSKNIWRSVRAKVSIIDQKLKLGREITDDDVAYLYAIKQEDVNQYIWTKIELLKLRLGDLSPKEFEQAYSSLYERLNAEKNIGLKKTLLNIKKDQFVRNERYEEALAVDKELEELKKEIAIATNEYIVQDLEAKYRKKEQELRIQYLDEQNEAKAMTMSEQRDKIMVTSVALGFITILSFFLYRLYSKVSTQKKVIASALTEKDLLLREIHHRVKNNLQMVSSLLSLQSKSISDEAAIQAINEGKSRVRSMALVHQDLYNKDNITDMGVKDYVEKLISELFKTFGVNEERVTVTLELEDVDLDIDTLVPLGLIINELITNSIKYAWPDGRKGELHVIFRREEEHLILQVNDDGVGYDPAVVRANSFGMTLVRALSKQLGGNLEISSNIGSRTRLKFVNE